MRHLVVSVPHCSSWFCFLSSSYDTKTGLKIAVKKLSRPFQSIIHAKRTYRELRLLKHMKHENVSPPPNPTPSCVSNYSI